MVLDIHKTIGDSWHGRSAVLLLASVLVALALPGLSLAEAIEQRTFASPEAAVMAMVEALRTDDVKALGLIFGPGSGDIIEAGDPVRDKAGRDRFLQLYDEKNSLEQTGNRAILSIGNEDWPFPIPIVKKDERWNFDAEEGKEELLARRIGKNEWSAVQFCLAYVDAQREYAQEDRDGDALLEYAQAFRSDEGKKNGLYWEVEEGEAQSPLGLFAARAQKQGYTMQEEKPSPYLGYYYRILTAQGQSAPGGAYDYMVKGNMIGGFALVAYPAQYESSGVMTFIVNHRGVVFQRDLGSNTEETAQAMTSFDPDSTWERADLDSVRQP